MRKRQCLRPHGEVTQNEERINVKIVISNLDIQETGGLYQVNDVKIVLDPVQVNYVFITEQDYFEVPYDGGERDEGGQSNYLSWDKPVGYVIIARPVMARRASFGNKDFSTLGQQHQKGCS